LDTLRQAEGRTARFVGKFDIDEVTIRTISVNALAQNTQVQSRYQLRPTAKSERLLLSLLNPS
jgi:hypothetical protein